MRCLLVSLWLVTTVFGLDRTQWLVASDWPAYRHDARRSAVSKDEVSFPLRLAWHRAARVAPQPAFADPLRHPTALDFAYVRDHSEPVLLDFDHAFHPVASAGRVFFGSSADDSVRCLSLETGTQEWIFVTGGPVRFAPHVVGDRVYVGSDDGFVYCLNTKTGRVVWQFRAAPAGRQLVGNGRMISRWPLRSGVLVENGTVFATAGMWPAEGVYVYALDAQTGELKWVNDTSGTLNQPTANAGAYAISGVAPTGYLLAGSGGLVVPTGRSIPASYDIKDGRLLASVAASYQNRKGGPAVCIDSFGNLVFGYPRERLTRKSYAVHYIYRLPRMQQFSTIRADDLVSDGDAFVVVNDMIRCYKSDARYRKVTVPWQDACPSKKVHSLALSPNALFVGVDNSVIARDRETGRVLWERSDFDGHVLSIAIVDGRLLIATDTGSIYCLASEAGPKSASSISSKFAPVSSAMPPNSLDQLAQPNVISLGLEAAGTRKGLALVIGERDTRLAAQLAANSELKVVTLLENSADVQGARQAVLGQFDGKAGHVAVQHYVQTDPLPFADFAFNLVISTNQIATKYFEQLCRVTRPAGGAIVVTKANETETFQARFKQDRDSTWASRLIDGNLVSRRGKLKGALDWDSQTTKDQRVKWPLELLWFGGPGSKRTGSGSRPPVAAGGRNFVIGKNHLIALDAYNGTELWSRKLPYLYRNYGRLVNAPGPIALWLTNSVSADDKHAYLNFGHVVYTLDAATGRQLTVHGELPMGPHLSLENPVEFLLNHYQQPNERKVNPVRTKADQAAGKITLNEVKNDDKLEVTLKLDSSVDLQESCYWELFFDVRAPSQRHRLYENGVFQLIIKPATGTVEHGLGVAHPKLSCEVLEKGRRIVLSIPLGELESLRKGTVPDSALAEEHELRDFCFAAALNHQASEDQKAMSGGRNYLRWEIHADVFSYAFNSGWPRIVLGPIDAGGSNIQSKQLSALAVLPEHALRAGRIGGLGKRAGYVVNVARERLNPLSLEVAGFEFNRGKGCGIPVSANSLQVLRSGSLAFYDLDDDSGMRYFGGVRPSCTISAVPAQGLVFAAEGSSGCSCNYNFKTTLALAPAKQRRHEDWAVFMAPLSPSALLQSGRFNLAAPGDRRDDASGLWLQFPRAPTYSNRSMPVPVELFGNNMQPYRVNADRVPITGTSRPWLYASGFEGIEGLRLQLFMSDENGIVVFPSSAPKLDAKLDESAWERRYAVSAGTGSSMLLSHDESRLFIGYEVVPPVDRRGKRQPWQVKRKLPYAAEFSRGAQTDDLDSINAAKDVEVWQEDSLEFLISDRSLKTVLHFGAGASGGWYDGRWSVATKKEDAAYSGKWSGAIRVSPDKASAEFSVPWQTLKDAGLDIENLVIRPRTKRPVNRQQHMSYGFRPVLVEAKQPKAKRYRVVLHFAELESLKTGDRVFDIEIQGKTVSRRFDLAKQSGARRAIVQQFGGIVAERALDIRFVKSNDFKASRPPILSAVEVLLEK